MVKLRTSDSRRHGGFTLVELLLVVAIIGVLAGMLLPTLGAVLHHAEILECKANLKQLATAVLSYSTDYQGTILPTRVEDSDLYWCNLLARRDISAQNAANLRDEQMSTQHTVLLCPATAAVRVRESSNFNEPDDPLAQGWCRLGNSSFATDCSYYWNGYVGNSDTDRERYPSLSVNLTNPRPDDFHNLSEIPQRSNLIMLTDGVFFQGIAGGTKPQRIAARHPGSTGARRLTNVAYYDGHVDSFDRDPTTSSGRINWSQEEFVEEEGDLVPIMNSSKRSPPLNGGPPYFMLPRR